MFIPQYQYKDKLNLKDRLDIAHTYIHSDGYYGVVTELAEDYDTNRQQIYSILSGIEEGFTPKPPGPSPKDPSYLLERIALFEEVNKQLKQENEKLQIRLQHSVEVTPKRLNRFLLTGLGEVLPYETLQTMVEVAYGEEYVPSIGTLSNLVNHAGTIAGLILDSEEVRNSFQAAACDEIFFHQQPILTVVEPDTMAIGAIEKSDDRKGDRR